MRRRLKEDSTLCGNEASKYSSGNVLRRAAAEIDHEDCYTNISI